MNKQSPKPDDRKMFENVQPDQMLLAAYLKDADHEAFSEIVRRHSPMVYRVCVRILTDHHEAEDASQSTFVVLLRKAASIRKRRSLASWLHGTARMTALHARRQRKSLKQRLEAATVNSDSADGTDDPFREQSLQFMDEALGKLSRLQREALVFRYLQGRPISEAAILSGCSSEKLRSRTRDGLVKLRKIFSRQGLAVPTGFLLLWFEEEAQAVSRLDMEGSLSAVQQSVAAYARTGTAVGDAVASLAEETMRTMAWIKAKTVAYAIALTLTVSATVAIGIAASNGARSRQKTVDNGDVFRDAWTYAYPVSAANTADWLTNLPDDPPLPRSALANLPATSDPAMISLEMERPEIPPGDNAAPFFAMAAAKDKRVENRLGFAMALYISNEPVDPHVLTEAFSEYEESVSLVLLGAERPKCIFPQDGLRIEDLASLRSISRTLAAKAKYNRLADRYTEAADWCISQLKYAGLVMQYPSDMIQYLVGRASFNHGLRQARDLAWDTNTPAEELHRLSRALSDIDTFVSDSFIRMLKADYKSVVKEEMTPYLSDLAEEARFWAGGEKAQTEMDTFLSVIVSTPWDKVKEAVGYRYRVVVADATRPYVHMSRFQAHKSGLPNAQRSDARTVQDFAGQHLDHLLQRKCLHEFELAATRTIVALNAYRKETGAYPNDLSALVPGYLDSVPSDPFDGMPLRYSSSSRAIYSPFIKENLPQWQRFAESLMPEKRLVTLP